MSFNVGLERLSHAVLTRGVNHVQHSWPSIFVFMHADRRPFFEVTRGLTFRAYLTPRFPIARTCALTPVGYSAGLQLAP